MFAKLLVATDGSDDAIRAAEVAAEIAERFGSQVILITVYSSPTFIGIESSAYDVPLDIVTDIQTSIIEHTSGPFLQRKIPFDVKTEIGSPAATIAQMAEMEGVDAIVLGSHGTGAMKRLLLGSVSDKVTHYAHCTVIIVKPEVVK